ncbi:MAG: S-methyl-5'-thioadenosine phosphorylase [Leptospirales bacterium]|nr:S-methyl-5'-thioadenosine phosphorylase [Leptospirales bacterium]
MAQAAKIGIIGGSGLYGLDGLKVDSEVTPETPWGRPSDAIVLGEFGGKHVAFLSRHGRGHSFTPSEVPFRANIAALKMLGVEQIIAFSAVGSLREKIAPRDFVLPSQIIDRTKGIRPSSFFENGLVAHASFGEPFDGHLAKLIKKAHKNIKGLKLHTDKVVICMEGPAFSTRAESQLYRSIGGDIINMSVLPEAKLAREAEIPYQIVCMSTDYDAWREHEEVVTTETVIGHLTANAESAKRLLVELLPLLGEGENPLKGTMKNAVITAPEKRNPEQVKKLNQILPGYF